MLKPLEEDLACRCPRLEASLQVMVPTSRTTSRSSPNLCITKPLRSPHGSCSCLKRQLHGPPSCFGSIRSQMLDQTNVAAARLLHLNFSLFKGSLLSANCCWMAWKRISWRWPNARTIWRTATSRTSSLVL